MTATSDRYSGNGYPQYLPVFAIEAIFAANEVELFALASRITASRRPKLTSSTLLVAAALLLPAGWDVTGLAPRLRATAAGFPLSIVGTAILVVTVWLSAGVGRFFDSRLLQWLGRISFSLYFVHEPILVSFAQVFGRHALWLAPAVGIPVAFLVAQLFQVLVERPSQRLARTIGHIFRGRPMPVASVTDQRGVHELNCDGDGNPQRDNDQSRITKVLIVRKAGNLRG